MDYQIALSSEADLSALQQQIEDFYERELLRHKLERTPAISLSVLEYRPERFDKTLVIIPGRAEIEHKYAELIYSLRVLPLRILIPFVRGQGSSSRVIPGSQKCHIDDFNIYRQDIEFMLTSLQVTDFLLLGFSMGGLISTDLYVNGSLLPRRMALIAPYFWPAYNLPEPILRVFVGIMGSLPLFNKLYTPHGSEYQKITFEENYHSHSRLRYELYHDYYASHPQLALAGPSYCFVRQSLLKQTELFHRRFDFSIPVFCAAAGEDKVVSSAHCAAFMQAHAHDSCPPIFTRISKAFHDILNECDEYRNPVLSRALSFLLND